MKIIPYGRHCITEEDILAVVSVLKSDYLTQGPEIGKFEIAFAEYVGSKYAVAVSNGTAALHLSAKVLGIKSSQKVITTPITFVATANCVRYCEGEIVFADIDADTYLIDIAHVRRILESSPKGTFAGIIPVNFAGMPVNLEEFRQLADEFGIWIIEDACHSPGGFFIDQNGNQQNCGNGNYADLSIFSFHPVKHIACGEGGMITTNNQELYKLLLKYRSHGIVRDDLQYKNTLSIASGNDDAMDKDQYPLWYMEMQDLGYNYRLTDFQAALGISQLKRADAGLKRRREIALKYDEAFKGNPNVKSALNELKSGSQSGHAYHLYVVEVKNRWGLYDYLRSKKIFAQIHYIPTHLMPYYTQFGWKKGDLPKAESYYDHCISLPMFSTLTDQEQNYVIESIISFYNHDSAATNL